MPKPKNEKELVRFIDLKRYALRHPAPEPNSVFADVVELAGRRYAGQAISSAVEALDDEALGLLLSYPNDILIHNNMYGVGGAGGYLSIYRVLDICGSGALKARLRDIDPLNDR